MKIKTVIVDDEPKSVRLLQKYLQPYSHTIEIVETAHDAEDAFLKINQNQPKLVFLDISMPGSSGLDLLNRFANKNFEVIFTTAHEQYAIEAFNLSAVHYLLKPIDLLQLDEAINRSIAKIKTDPSLRIPIEKRKIVIYTQNGYELIEEKQIVRCEASGAYTEIYLNNKRKIISSQNLKSFEQQLDSKSFLRIHKSHLINLDEVQSFTRGKNCYAILKDHTQIFISNQRKNDFFQRISNSFIADEEGK
jgi:two-component system LytT family response regulator